MRPYGTVRTVKDNAPRHRSGVQSGPVQHHTYREGPWEITTHWATVAGRQTLVGLDVRSFTEPDGDPLPTGYAEITQRVLRNLSDVDDPRAGPGIVGTHGDSQL